MSSDHGSAFLGGKSSGAMGIPSASNDDRAQELSASGISSSYPYASSFESFARSTLEFSDRILHARERTVSLVDSREKYEFRRPLQNWYRNGMESLTERSNQGSEMSSAGSESGSRATVLFKNERELANQDSVSNDGTGDCRSLSDYSDMAYQLNQLQSFIARPPMNVAHYPMLHDAVSCTGFDNRWPTFGNPFPPTDTAVDSKAFEHRRSALHAEPRCTWSGQLPNRQHKNPTYSPKVFLGGVPWDITDSGLSEAFSQFGQVRVQWPGREARGPTFSGSPKQGYLYVIFESDKRVKELLQLCTHDFSNGGKYYFNISSRRMRSKEVQVIPWIISDSNYVRCPSQRLDPSKTVFVGALHGMLTAEGLAHVANDLFGGVAYVGIDTDKFKYPIGSGRVTFNNQKSYMKAVQAAFVDIKATRFTKKIQIDPYLENSLCSSCNMQPGPIFCRDTACFRYFCRSCWKWIHSTDDLQHHKPIMRNRRD